MIDAPREPEPIDPRDTKSKYHDLAFWVMANLNADAVALVVIGGVHGTGGGSVATTAELQHRLALQMGKLAGEQDRHATDLETRG